jgi:hypothetical protein
MPDISDEVLLLDNDEPATYKEAMMDPDSVKWLNAMKSERIHVREPSLELGRPSKRLKAYQI